MAKVSYDRRALARLLRAKDLDDGQVAASARMSQRQLVYLRRGVCVPRADTLAALATALGVDPNAFFRAEA